MPKKKEPIFECKGYNRESHDVAESGFYLDKGRATGRSSLCKECKKARNREYFSTTYYPAHKTELIKAVQDRRQVKGEGEALT